MSHLIRALIGEFHGMISVSRVLPLAPACGCLPSPPPLPPSPYSPLPEKFGRWDGIGSGRWSSEQAVKGHPQICLQITLWRNRDFIVPFHGVSQGKTKTLRDFALTESVSSFKKNPTSVLYPWCVSRTWAFLLRLKWIVHTWEGICWKGNFASSPSQYVPSHRCWSFNPYQH